MMRYVWMAVIGLTMAVWWLGVGVFHVLVSLLWLALALAQATMLALDVANRAAIERERDGSDALAVTMQRHVRNRPKMAHRGPLQPRRRPGRPWSQGMTRGLPPGDLKGEGPRYGAG